MKIASTPAGPGGANTYIVSDENTNKGFIVDLGGHDKGITNYINENVIDVEYIILTHGHGDHIGGVADFIKDFPKVKVVASEKEKETLNDASLNLSTGMFASPVTLDADIYVKDGETLKVGDMELKFFSTPGHSPGGMCILVDKVLFSGDTLFQQSVGRTDFPGSSFEELKKSIHNKIFTLPDDTQVMPGHMGTTTVAFEKENNPFV